MNQQQEQQTQQPMQQPWQQQQQQQYQQQQQQQQQYPQQQQQYPQQQQPQVVYITQAPVQPQRPIENLGKYGPHYSTSSAKCSGGWLITIGLVSIPFATVAWLFLAENAFDYAGYWCGAIMFLAGCVASHSGSHRQDTVIIVATISAILSVVFATVQFGISLNGLIYDVQCNNCYVNYLSTVSTCISTGTNYYKTCSTIVTVNAYNYGLAVASNSILFAVAAIAWIPSLALLVNGGRAIHKGHASVKPVNDVVVVQVKQ